MALAALGVLFRLLLCLDKIFLLDVVHHGYVHLPALLVSFLDAKYLFAPFSYKPFSHVENQWVVTFIIPEMANGVLCEAHPVPENVRSDGSHVLYVDFTVTHHPGKCLRVP